MVGELQLFVPLEGLVDLDAERVRLDKELGQGRRREGQERGQAGWFGAGVPAAVVEQERLRLADWTGKLAALAEQRARLG